MAAAGARCRRGFGGRAGSPGDLRMSEELVRRHDPWRGAPDPGPRDVLAGMVRVAAGACVRTAAWSLGVSVRVGRAAGDPRAASELARDLVADLQNLARDLMGVSDLSLDERIKRLLPPAAAPVEARGENGGASDLAALRDQAAELLRQAADVNF